MRSPTGFRASARVRKAAGALAGLCVAMTATGSHAGDDLDAIVERDRLVCGVNPGAPGFAAPDADGAWRGLDADFCRAVAIAILGDSAKVDFRPLSATERFVALAAGEVDVLSRDSTFTLQRDAGQGIQFTSPNYFDGLSFMIPNDLGATAPEQLANATVCVLQGSTDEIKTAEFFRTNDIPYQPLVLATMEGIDSAFYNGRCDAYAGNFANLAGSRNASGDAGRYTILDELLTMEPYAPAVRRGDPELFSIVRWTMFALIEAEVLGVTNDNVGELATSSDNEDIQRLLGSAGGNGAALGLREAWVSDIVSELGNYGEIYTRHLGEESPLGLPRGLNALWTDGGLMYAPPLR